MIVAIASLDGHYKTLLSANLAVLRARSGRKICLIDTDPRECAYSWGCDRSIAAQAPSVMARTLSGPMLSREIENLGPSYGDLLINTGRYDRHETLSALIAARIVIVPVTVNQVDIDVHYALVARLNSARMFNPALKVIFVLVTDSSTPSRQQLAAVSLYVAQVMSATLAHAVLHVHDMYDYGLGRCVCDAQTCDPEAAAELNSLYHEVYIH